VPPKSTTKSPETRKYRLSASTLTLLIAEPANANPVIWWRLAGMQNDWRDEHPPNTNSPRAESLPPALNDKFESFVQPEKHPAEIVSMDEGMQIDWSEEQPSKANSPRFEIWQADSNVKSERFSHWLKQQLEIIWVDEGIQMDWSDEHFSKADSPRSESLAPGSNVK
jgi:hypothetical protein